WSVLHLLSLKGAVRAEGICSRKYGQICAPLRADVTTVYVMMKAFLSLYDLSYLWSLSASCYRIDVFT
ncbi:TPA: hypothetical protein ACH9OT_005034, partial [Escherichia coli]